MSNTARFRKVGGGKWGTERRRDFRALCWVRRGGQNPREEEENPNQHQGGISKHTSRTNVKAEEVGAGTSFYSSKRKKTALQMKDLKEKRSNSRFLGGRRTITEVENNNGFGVLQGSGSKKGGAEKGVSKTPRNIGGIEGRRQQPPRTSHHRAEGKWLRPLTDRRGKGGVEKKRLRKQQHEGGNILRNCAYHGGEGTLGRKEKEKMSDSAPRRKGGERVPFTLKA